MIISTKYRNGVHRPDRNLAQFAEFCAGQPAPSPNWPGRHTGFRTGFGPVFPPPCVPSGRRFTLHHAPFVPPIPPWRSAVAYQLVTAQPLSTINYELSTTLTGVHTGFGPVFPPPCVPSGRRFTLHHSPFVPPIPPWRSAVAYQLACRLLAPQPLSTINYQLSTTLTGFIPICCSTTVSTCPFQRPQAYV